MTENLPPNAPDPARGDPAGPPPPTAETRADPPPVPPRRLLRSRDDRVIAGVSSGIAAHLGVDAVLVRLAFIVLTFFGGAGVLAYVAAIFLMPEAPAGTAVPVGAAATSERNRTLTVVGLVLLVLVVGPLLLVPAAVIGGVAVPLAVLALAGLLTAWAVTGRRPARDAGALVRQSLLGLGILLLLGALAVAAFWAAGLGGGIVVSALVIAAGVAVLAGAVLRPVRWLILPALAVAIPAGFIGAAGVELDGGVGDRSHRPGDAGQVAAKYELGAGRLVVDLRGADLPAGDRRLALEMGMGEAVLIVPEDVCVSSDARVGMGLVELFDREHGGVDVDVMDRTGAPSGTTRLVVDADVGLGHLDVRHTSPPPHETADDDDDGWRRGRGLDDDVETDEAGNEACSGAAS